jgi:hypothetical protein
VLGDGVIAAPITTAEGAHEYVRFLVSLSLRLLIWLSPDFSLMSAREWGS